MADIETSDLKLNSPLDEWEVEFYEGLDEEERLVWLDARNNCNPLGGIRQLPASGQISMSEIRAEVGGSGQCSLNDAAFRDLINKNSGQQQAMSEYYGKKASQGHVWGTPSDGKYGNMGELMNNEPLTCYQCPQASGNALDTVWGVANSCYTTYDGFKECGITPTWNCPTGGGAGSIRTYYQELGYFDNNAGKQWFWLHVKRQDGLSPIPYDSAVKYQELPFEVSWSGGGVTGAFRGQPASMGSAREVLMSRPVSGLADGRGKAWTWTIGT